MGQKNNMGKKGSAYGVQDEHEERISDILNQQRISVIKRKRIQPSEPFVDTYVMSTLLEGK